MSDNVRRKPRPKEMKNHKACSYCKGKGVVMVDKRTTMDKKSYKEFCAICAGTGFLEVKGG